MDGAAKNVSDSDSTKESRLAQGSCYWKYLTHCFGTKNYLIVPILYTIDPPASHRAQMALRGSEAPGRRLP